VTIWGDESMGKRVERFRLVADMTQFQLGEITGFGEEAVYRIEADLTGISHSPEWLQTLAEALGVSAEEILRGDTPAERETKALIDETFRRGECTEEEAGKLKEMGTAVVRRRANGRIPLRDLEIKIMLEALRNEPS